VLTVVQIPKVAPCALACPKGDGSPDTKEHLRQCVSKCVVDILSPASRASTNSAASLPSASPLSLTDNGLSTVSMAGIGAAAGALVLTLTVAFRFFILRRRRRRRQEEPSHEPTRTIEGPEWVVPGPPIGNHEILSTPVSELSSHRLTAELKHSGKSVKVLPFRKYQEPAELEDPRTPVELDPRAGHIDPRLLGMQWPNKGEESPSRSCVVSPLERESVHNEVRGRLPDPCLVLLSSHWHSFQHQMEVSLPASHSTSLAWSWI
jgi:hypothetical protein